MSYNYLKSACRSYTRTLSVTSGKGGVGKSTLVANMALGLSQQGKRILILDGDLGMANIDIMYGIRYQKSIYDVLQGNCELRDIIVEVSPNIYLIPGGSGVYDLQNLNTFQKKILLDQVSQLDGCYDYLLIDTAPGVSDNVLYLNSSAHEILIVLTPDPSSLADTYALIKLLNQKHREQHFSIVCNFVKNDQEAMMVFKRLSDVCSKFLCVRLDYKGYIPLDQQLRIATKSQQLVLREHPRCPSSFAIQSLVEKISHCDDFTEIKGGMQFFWQQLVGVA